MNEGDKRIKKHRRLVVLKRCFARGIGEVWAQNYPEADRRWICWPLVLFSALERQGPHDIDGKTTVSATFANFASTTKKKKKIMHVFHGNRHSYQHAPVLIGTESLIIQKKRAS